MPTGDEFVKLAMKRFISENRLDENFLEYLQETFHDGMSRIFPASGLFTYPVTITPTATPAEFDLSPDPIEGIDNAGHVFVIGTALLNDIPFENVAGQKYWIGFKYAEIVSDVYTNPRTGQFEYDKMIETTGEKDDPDTVTDLTGTIRFVVDSLFTNGVDHSGRVVKVYLKNPMSGDASVAIEECTVTYDGGSGENRITTTGTLGQSTVSTTASDYTVVCEGCTVRKNATNPLGDEYMMIGYIEGHATLPTTGDGDQRDLSGGGGHTLQKAYDGLAGSGSGKNVTAADGAIHVSQENNSTAESDIYHAALRITKDLDKSAFGLTGDIEEQERGIDIKTRYTCKGAVVHRVNLQDLSGNDYLSAEETISVDAAGARIRFTRGGVDITLPGINAYLNVASDVIEIKGSTLGNDGIYYIDTIVDLDEMDLYDVFGNTASLAQETSNPALKVSIYREVFMLGRNYDAIKMTTLADFQNDGSDSGSALDIDIPSTADDAHPVVDIRRLPSSDFLIYNNLDLDSDGTIKSNHINVAIEATAGDVKANQNVTATSGVVRAIVGNVTAGNDVIANQDVTATNGSVTADVDVTANTGDVEAVLGDVIAGNDVIADVDIIADADGNAIGDFKHGSSRNYKTRYGAEDAAIIDEVNPWTRIFNITYTDMLELKSQAVAKSVIIPFKLPQSVTLNAVRVLVNPFSTGTMGLKIWKSEHSFISDTEDQTPTQLGTTDYSSGSGNQKLEVLSISETINNDGARYYAQIISGNTDDRVWGMIVEWSTNVVKPSGG